MRRLPVAWVDRVVLLGVQTLVVGVPLLLGGIHDATTTLACPLVFTLLALTVWRRRHEPVAPDVPGVAALAAFVALGGLSAVPLPPALLAWLAPATEHLYRWTLPGWPVSGGWTGWRSIAIDAYAVWTELLRFSIGFGVFAVIVAYPWADGPRGEPGRARVFRVLFLTLAASGLGFAALAFIQEASGADRVLWTFDAPMSQGRLIGPFVNPNHFAAWLEIVVPAVAMYAIAVTNETRIRLRDAAAAGRVGGVQARRAWAGALIANQGRLWLPLVAVTAGIVLVAAHLATDSRGGRAALVAGFAVVVFGLVARRGPAWSRRLVQRHAALLVVAIPFLATGSLVVLAGSAEVGSESAAREVDVDTGMRLAVAAKGFGVIADHLALGTGLGTWLHAFRPYQAPPVEDGIWDHAHNDYLELTAETGVVGLALALAFAVAVARAMQRRQTGEEEPAARRRGAVPAGFEEADWLAGLRDTPLLRWGLLGGVIAILVHSFTDFSLRMPANLLALMVVLALLVVTGTPRAIPRASPAPLMLLTVLLIAAVVPLWNGLRGFTGAAPLSAEAALDAADRLLAEDDDRTGAVAMARLAIDRSPANRDAHEMLAKALGPGDDGDAALRRAIALEPWAPELRDALGLRHWARGERAAAARELEESMFRYPNLETHAYLKPDSGIFPPASSRQLLQELVEGETLSARLALLDTEMVDAIERGLRRALEAPDSGLDRAATTADVVTLLEARGRRAEAAQALRAQGEERLDDTDTLARAARDYLRVKDFDQAEETLLTAIKRTPEQGALYRELAIDVYARQGQFDMAETILESGERNAIDLVPIYRGMTDVLARRETAGVDSPALARLDDADTEGAEPDEGTEDE